MVAIDQKTDWQAVWKRIWNSPQFLILAMHLHLSQLGKGTTSVAKRICVKEEWMDIVSWMNFPFSFFSLLLTGEWKPGFKYNRTSMRTYSQAPWVNEERSCGKKEREIHFEFYNKSLNGHDSVHKLIEKLRNKKLVWLGDSLQKQYLFGLMHIISQGKWKFPWTCGQIASWNCSHLENCVNVWRPVHTRHIHTGKRFGLPEFSKWTASISGWTQIQGWCDVGHGKIAFFLAVL